MPSKNKQKQKKHKLRSSTYFFGIVFFSIGLVAQVAFVIFSVIDRDIHSAILYPLIPLVTGYIFIRLAGFKLREAAETIADNLFWFI
jgi:hypothetical protein